MRGTIPQDTIQNVTLSSGPGRPHLLLIVTTRKVFPVDMESAEVLEEWQTFLLKWARIVMVGAGMPTVGEESTT